jgi:methylated-DNA-[protein]-cysteine S-methyltransferase
MPKVTEFQQRVYDACSLIPKGRVTTYGKLAQAIDCGSARAVGQALRCNPFAPEVPCHRVIKSDRSLGGFYGQTDGEEVRRKRKLLESEGVEFDEDGKVKAGCGL